MPSVTGLRHEEPYHPAIVCQNNVDHFHQPALKALSFYSFDWDEINCDRIPRWLMDLSTAAFGTVWPYKKK